MDKSLNTSGSIMALDVGAKRVGVALAHMSARMAHPRTTLENPVTFYDDIEQLILAEEVRLIVIGLPRGLDGQDTAQTNVVRSFGAELEDRVSIPVYWMDEALTSVKAEEELQQRGKQYAKTEVDALAATYILEDFIREHPEAFND